MMSRSTLQVFAFHDQTRPASSASNSVVAYPEIQGCSLWDSISLCTLNRGSQVGNIVFSPLYTHGDTWVEVAMQLAPRCTLTEVHGLRLQHI